MGRDSEETTRFISPSHTYLPVSSSRSRENRGLKVGIAALVGLNTVTLLLLLLNAGPALSKSPDLLYSQYFTLHLFSCICECAAYGLPGPLQDEVSYEVVHFHDDVEQETIYQRDPSPQVDAAWKDLYMRQCCP